MTIFCNEVTVRWNEVTWNEVTMGQTHYPEHNIRYFLAESNLSVPLPHPISQFFEEF